MSGLSITRGQIKSKQTATTTNWKQNCYVFIPMYAWYLIVLQFVIHKIQIN